jgi:predicted acetyltransferase
LNSDRSAWLIKVADRLGGFVMTRRLDDGAMSISDFFVVRAARRNGIGREAARLVICQFAGQWRIAYQSYNPGAQRFWTRVATDAVGDKWRTYEDEPDKARPADTWITFTTLP